MSSADQPVGPKTASKTAREGYKTRFHGRLVYHATIQGQRRSMIEHHIPKVPRSQDAIHHPLLESLAGRESEKKTWRWKEPWRM